MRFTTVDPVKDSFNWYVYVGNDPVNFVDPYGLFTNKQVGTAFMILGGVGLFVGGGVPAALVMAAGAILYEAPDEEDATIGDQAMQMMGSIANLSEPSTAEEAVAESIENLTNNTEPEVSEESTSGTEEKTQVCK